MGSSNKDGLGFHGQRTGDRNTLLLPAGQFRRIMVRPIGQADPFQFPHRDVCGLLLSDAADLHGSDPHIVDRPQMGEQVEVLEHEGEPLANVIEIVPRNLLALEPDRRRNRVARGG